MSVVKRMAYLAVSATFAVATAVAASEPSATTTAPAKTVKTWWAYEPVKTVETPAVKQEKWVRTPVDAFVLAQLEQKNLKPSPDADRTTFIRRATLDTLGLIPTPQEVDAFVKDRSPDAYEKLVDRLLSSPQYGERQARRWLDLARYADSAGFQGDQTRPNMWRYRDYVIDAFNQDKPYDRFVKEQIAGDELPDAGQAGLVATGFLRGYPDNANSRDLVQKKYQHTTDMTDTVGEVFLAQTVACARCHNHKADRISQKEYFQLQAFFANTNTVDEVPAEKTQQEIDFEKAQAAYKEATRDIKAKQKAIIDKVRKEAELYNYERYAKTTQTSLRKDEGQWDAVDRWVHNRYGDYLSDNVLSSYLEDNSAESAPHYHKEYRELYAEYQRLQDELKKFDALKPTGSVTISAMSELGHTDAPPTYVFAGGDNEHPLDEVQPGFPAAISTEQPAIASTANSSGRRTALANWIASPSNPLTARVFVNRVWDQYFGRGIVSTVSDFGRAGQRPTHSQLLDYLANDFVSHGWSVKALHKQILLSSTYRQSSAFREEVFAADPENKLLGVFPRRRLEAEQIRDSLLVAAGELESKVGGPAVFPPVPSNLNAGDLWRVTEDPHAQNRRSIYIFTRRSVPYPLLQPFDMASAQQAHSKRDVTTTPLQALTLFNSDVVFGWSKALAGRVIDEAGNNESAQLDQLYRILFSRTPDKDEKAALRAFLDEETNVVRSKAADGKLALAVPTGLRDPSAIDPVRAAAFVDLVHAVANSNEFTYRF